jgi:hypothetical protein
MLGKVIGAVVGERLAKQVGGVNGAGGALLGVGAAAVLRRLGPVGMIAAALGGYALKRHYEKQPKARSAASR